MKKIVFLMLLFITMTFQLVAGSLDFLKPGEYAYFIDRRGSDIYYKGITYLPEQKGKMKVFMIRYVNMKTKDECVFQALIDDSNKLLRGDTILGEYGEAIQVDQMKINTAVDFICMLQFYINNEYRIEDDINLLYKAENVPQEMHMQLATLSSPRFKVLRLGKIVQNGHEEIPAFEIDRMGDLKTTKDIKAFKKYMPK